MTYSHKIPDNCAPHIAALQRDMTKRFISMSGPDYVDVPLLVVWHDPAHVVVDWQDGEGPEVLFPRHISLASWYILQAAEVGAVVMVKVRADDVGLRL